MENLSFFRMYIGGGGVFGWIILFLIRIADWEHMPIWLGLQGLFSDFIHRGVVIYLSLFIVGM